MCEKIKYSPNISVIPAPGRDLSDIAIIDE